MTALSKILMLEGGGVVSLVGAGGKTSLMFRIAQELSMAGESVLTTTTTKMRMPTPEQSPHVIVSDVPDTLLRTAKGLLPQALHLSAASGKIASGEKLDGFQPEVIDEIRKAGLFQWILVEADGAAGKPLKAPAAHEPVIPASSRWVIGVAGLDGVNKSLDAEWVFRPDLYAALSGLAPGDRVTAASVAASLLHEKGIMKGSPPDAGRFVFLNKADCPGGLAAGRKIVRHLGKQKECTLKRVIIGKALYQPSVVEYFDWDSGGIHGKSFCGLG